MRKVDRGREGIPVSGHPFQCSFCKKEAGIQRPFYHHLPALKSEK